MTDLKNGDVVLLKSGGPIMTIDYISIQREKATCIWFDKNNEFFSQDFCFYVLKKID
jgi:uncharacterized protein YodC (DUF2158 family)